MVRLCQASEDQLESLYYMNLHRKIAPARSSQIASRFPKPACSSKTYGRGGTVGRGRGVGVVLGDGCPVGVGVAVAVAVGVVTFSVDGLSTARSISSLPVGGASPVLNPACTRL